MNKELEALKRIKMSHHTAIAVMGCERDYETENAIDVIEQTLIKSQEDEKENERLWNDITTVSKQYSDLMLDYQEQKKVLEIIKEKPLSVLGLTLIKKFDKDGVLELDYQTFVDAYKTMTEDFDEDMKEQIASQEEFELVKRYFK